MSDGPPEDWAEEDGVDETARERRENSVRSDMTYRALKSIAPSRAASIERSIGVVGRGLWYVGLVGAASYLMYSVVSFDPILSVFIGIAMIGAALQALA